MSHLLFYGIPLSYLLFYIILLYINYHTPYSISHLLSFVIPPPSYHTHVLYNYTGSCPSLSNCVFSIVTLSLIEVILYHTSCSLSSCAMILSVRRFLISANWEGSFCEPFKYPCLKPAHTGHTIRTKQTNTDHKTLAEMYESLTDLALWLIRVRLWVRAEKTNTDHIFIKQWWKCVSRPANPTVILWTTKSSKWYLRVVYTDTANDSKTNGHAEAHSANCTVQS